VKRAVALLAALVALAVIGYGGYRAYELYLPPTTESAAPSAATVADPKLVEIPALGVSSDLIPLYRDENGKLQAPPLDDPMQAGWYAEGVRPGEVGPAVIAAHVNAHGNPGLFKDLHTLAPGEPIYVDDMTFIVDRVEQHDKDEFPTLAVYGNTDRPELRLITCGGEINRQTRHYEDNIIVFASLSE